MALISVANVELAFGDHRVLDGVNMTIDAGDHVGMVGRNGSGKSTLLKLVAGLDNLKADVGQVQILRGSTIGYLTQDPVLDLDLTMREEAGKAFAALRELHVQLDAVTHEMAEADGDQLERLMKRYEQIEHKLHAAGGYAVDHQVDATLHGLGLGDETFDVKVRDLSGGQKGRLSLAKLLLSSPDAMLLDEPTNHLDIAGREWLEQYLQTFAGAVVLVSHDRWLLDRVASRIFEVEQGRVFEYPGNYSIYRELRAERKLTEQRVFDKQQDKIRQEKAFIGRYKAGQRAKQARGREKRLERFIEQEVTDRPMEEDTINLTFPAPQRSGDMVLTADGISVTYEGKKLFADMGIVIKRGTRLGVIGPNGAGKSTLMRCLLGEQEPHTGRTRLGSQLSIGHYRQTHEGLDPSRSVVEYLQRLVPSNTEQEARDLAGAFMFSGLDQDKPLGVLSGGERSRAVLAGLMVQGHNLLVLDEPTNHLDVQSAERLESALRQFTGAQAKRGVNRERGTLLLVTHDRMLLDDLVDELLVLDGHGHVQHFYGNYSEYIAQQSAEAPPPLTMTRRQTTVTAARASRRIQSRSSSRRAIPAPYWCSSVST